MTNIILSEITRKEKQILLYIYKFRFIHTYQLQKLFNHKDPHRIKEWLKHLLEIGHIQSDYKDYIFPHKPANYSLTKLSRKLLKMEEDCDIRVLNLVYNKRELTEESKQYYLTIVDLYLFFLREKEIDSTLQFFTENDLITYENLKTLDLSGFMAISNGDETKRYFLHLFKPHTPPFVYRSKIKDYLRYYDTNIWQDSADDKPFPKILFVCHSEIAKKHVIHYAKAIFDMSYDEKFELYITTTKTILNNTTDIWERVE